MARSMKTRNEFRPQMEGLDARLVPAVVGLEQTGLNAVGGGLAVITANDANDTITITNSGTGAVSVSGAGLAAGSTLDARVRRIQVNTNGGNDTVIYNLTGNQARSMRLEANLGNGNDTFTANQNGFNVINGAAEIIRVDGGSGANRITVNAAGTASNRVDINAGASLQLQLIGGGDFDLFDAGDVIAVDYQGELDGTLRLEEDGGLGGDSLRAAVTLDSGSSGIFRGFGGAAANLNGGAGVDVLDFRIFDKSGGHADVALAEANAGLDFDTEIVRHTAGNVKVLFASGGEDRIVV